jgi:hypothetical protein
VRVGSFKVSVIGIAVIGALVLLCQGSDTGRQHSANAITVGFIGAAVGAALAPTAEAT